MQFFGAIFLSLKICLAFFYLNNKSNQFFIPKGSPQYIYNTSNSGSNSNFEAIKLIKHTAKKTVNKKIQKFLNMFKRNNTNNAIENDNSEKRPDESSLNQHQINLDIKKINKKKPLKDANLDEVDSRTIRSTPSPRPPTNGTTYQQIVVNNSNLFHKVTSFKSWDALFDSMIHHTCLIGVKLNLAKPPKYNEIIFNYIESAQKKFELLLQQHQQKILNQQQKQNMNNQNNHQRAEPHKVEHFCLSKRNDCRFDNLCSNCLNNSNLRSMPLAASNTNYNQYSYNTSSTSLKSNGNNNVVLINKNDKSDVNQAYDENCHLKSYYL